jgi:SAM-dependent methyltransferase
MDQRLGKSLAMSAERQAQAGLHPLVGGFDDAEIYDRARHRYGAEVTELLIEQLELAPGAPVLELGAGTGQLSRALVDAGLSLTAVEPLGPTRALLERAIGAERVLDGRAEQIPLPDGAVEAVLAADAFHWFDEVRAMPEIRRVLRPGGGVAILRTTPVLDEPWSRELGTIITEARPEHPAFTSRGAAAALEEDPAFGPVSDLQVRTRASFDRARIVALFASFSWVGSLPAQEREQLLQRADAVLERHGVADVDHDVLHQIWLARLLPAG